MAQKSRNSNVLISNFFGQMFPRGRMYRYPGRNAPDSNLPVLPVPYDLSGGMFPRDAAGATAMGQPMPITALASSLANAPPEQQRTVCMFVILHFVNYSD